MLAQQVNWIAGTVLSRLPVRHIQRRVAGTWLLSQEAAASSTSGGASLNQPLCIARRVRSHPYLSVEDDEQGILLYHLDLTLT
jgi:hypothetical protein